MSVDLSNPSWSQASNARPGHPVKTRFYANDRGFAVTENLIAFPGCPWPASHGQPTFGGRHLLQNSLQGKRSRQAFFRPHQNSALHQKSDSPMYFTGYRAPKRAAISAHAMGKDLADGPEHPVVCEALVGQNKPASSPRDESRQLFPPGASTESQPTPGNRKCSSEADFCNLKTLVIKMDRSNPWDSLTDCTGGVIRDVSAFCSLSLNLCTEGSNPYLKSQLALFCGRWGIWKARPGEVMHKTTTG